jgi:hypothetical protein
MRLKILAIIIILLLLYSNFCFAAAPPAPTGLAERSYDTTIHVDVSGSDSNDGSSGSPYLTIMKAVDNASGFTQVKVGEGTYVETVIVCDEEIQIMGGYDNADGWSRDPLNNVTNIDVRGEANGSKIAIYVKETAAGCTNPSIATMVVDGFTVYGQNSSTGTAETTIYSLTTNFTYQNLKVYGIDNPPNKMYAFQAGAPDRSPLFINGEIHGGNTGLNGKIETINIYNADPRFYNVDIHPGDNDSSTSASDRPVLLGSGDNEQSGVGATFDYVTIHPHYSDNQDSGKLARSLSTLTNNMDTGYWIVRNSVLVGAQGDSNDNCDVIWTADAGAGCEWDCWDYSLWIFQDVHIIKPNCDPASSDYYDNDPEDDVTGAGGTWSNVSEWATIAAYEASEGTIPVRYTEAKALGNLTWNSSAGATGYKVYYGTSTGNYDGERSPIDVGNVTDFVVPYLQHNTRYYFAVTAYNAVPEESTKSSEINFESEAYGVVAGAISGMTIN